MSTDELSMLWSIALQVYGPDILGGTEKLDVVSVTLKTKKRPARPTVRVGDVFAIPIGPRTWAFGRIVNLEDSWPLIEVFSHVSRSPSFNPDIVTTPPLLPLLTVDVEDAFGSRRWRVVHSDPEYARNLSGVEFAMGTDHPQAIYVNSFAPHRRISRAEADDLPQWEFMVAEATEKRIRSALTKANIVEHLAAKRRKKEQENE